ncbi:hypothetical protein SKAU_G00378800, partial [Synaphobranchus kaupii]
MIDSLSAAGRVRATDVKSRSVTLCWESPVSMEGVSYEIHIIYGCEGRKPRRHISAPNTTTAALSDLKPGMEYNFSITAVFLSGSHKKISSTCIHTKPSAPGRVRATDVESRSARLCWERPVRMEGVSYEILITYSCEGEEPRSHICAPNATTAALSDLKPGMEYNFNITAVLPNGICSKTSSTCIHTNSEEETTNNRSSLGPEAEAEDGSSYLAQSSDVLISGYMAQAAAAAEVDSLSSEDQ